MDDEWVELDEEIAAGAWGNPLPMNGKELGPVTFIVIVLVCSALGIIAGLLNK